MSPQSENTVMALANAIELATEIISEVAGNEVSDMLNGSVVSRASMNNIVSSRLARNFSTYLSQSAKQ